MKIADKIRKLLDLAASEADGGNDDAARNIAARAQSLLAQHGLTMASVDEARREAEDPMTMASVDFQTLRVPAWLSLLAASIADACGCFMLTQRKYLEGGVVQSHAMFYGREAAATTAAYLYAYLRGEVDRLAKLNAKGRGKQFAQSYRTGLVAALDDRLRETFSDIAAESQAQGLVLVNAAREAEAWARTQTKWVSATPSRASLDREGGRAGMRDAEEIQLRGGAELNESRLALGQGTP